MWASSSTRATCGPAGEDRVDVHLLERRAAVLDAACAARPRGRRSARRSSARPCVSTKPTTTSVPRSARRRPSFEHRERLADAGRGAEVDAERARVPCAEGYAIARVEREVQLEHVDAGLAEEAERAAVGVLVDEREDVGERRGRAPARRARPGSGRSAGEMCGSRPEPEAVTASTGTGAPARAVRRAGRRRAARATSSRRSGFVGPEVRGRARRRVVAVAGGRGARVEVARARRTPGRSGASRRRGRRARRASRPPCREPDLRDRR